MAGSLIFLVVMMAAFYVLLIRPQQKRMRQQAQLLHAIKAGDEVITIGGIFALVTRVLDDRFEVEVADGTRFYVLRSAIARRVGPEIEDEIMPAEGEDEGVE